METNTASVGARLGLSGTLEFKDKDGNVIKRMPFAGSVPLESAGLSVEQAQELITAHQLKEAHHGRDDRK